MAYSLPCLLVVITTFTLALALPEVIRIGEFTFQMFRFINSNPYVCKTGGLFDSSDPMPESAFRQALDRINENGRFLPKSNLVSLSERLPPSDSHFASKRGQRPISRQTRLIITSIYVSISTLFSMSDAPQRIGGCSWPFILVDFFSHPIHLRCFRNSTRQYGLSIETPTDPVRHQFASASFRFRPGLRRCHPYLGLEDVLHSLRRGRSHGAASALAESVHHVRLQNQRPKIASNG